MTPHPSGGGCLVVLGAFVRSNAPHAGVPIDARLSFWRDFVHSATRIHRSVGLPKIIAGMRMCGTLTSDAHQALRLIGPSFCGLVDIIMQFGDLQSQGAGHPRWWRRVRLRFHLQSLSESTLATIVVMKRKLSFARVRSLLVRCTIDSTPSWSFEKVRMEASSSSQGLITNPPPCTQCSVPLKFSIGRSPAVLSPCPSP